MRRRSSRAFVATMLLASLLTVTAATPAQATSCTQQEIGYRAGKRSADITVAEGISGVLRTPVAGTIKGTNATRPSAGDLFFTNAAGEFVQLGWYLGGVAPSSSSTGLPDAETNPRLFWGESFDPSTESLHAGITLSWGTYYQFKIEKTSTPGIYNLSIQGIVQAQNYHPHSLGIPVFQGEVNNLCTTMDALASHASAPKRTLEYLYNGAWNYWDTTNFPATPGFFTSENVGDIATDHAYSNP